MRYQAQLIGSAGEALRDAGIAQAVDHANQECPSWSEKAYIALKEFLRRTPQRSFMTEEVRCWAHQEYGLPRPPHSRAWGGIMARAAKHGLIRKIGITQVRNKTAHCANAAVWTKAQ